MAKPKDNASDAGKQYAEIWGETIHSNRHLRVFSIVLGVLLLCVTIAVVRLSSVEPPRPIVVRVDEVGRAEALAYETVEARPTPATRPPSISSTAFSMTTSAAAGRRRSNTGPAASGFSAPIWPTRPSPPATRKSHCWPPESPPKNSGLRMSCFGFKPIPLRRTGRWPTSSSSAPGRNGRYPAKHGRPRCSLFSCRSYRPIWSFSIQWESRSHTWKPIEP